MKYKNITIFEKTIVGHKFIMTDVQLSNVQLIDKNGFVKWYCSCQVPPFTEMIVDEKNQYVRFSVKFADGHTETFNEAFFYSKRFISHYKSNEGVCIICHNDNDAEYEYCRFDGISVKEPLYKVEGTDIVGDWDYCYKFCINHYDNLPITLLSKAV